jgi:hypothetical protein
VLVAQEAEIVGGGEGEGRGIGRQGKEGVPEQQLLLQAGEGLACARTILNFKTIGAYTESTYLIKLFIS